MANYKASSLASLAVVSVLMLTGCHQTINTSNDDVQVARNLIKNELRDPSSAEFRSERVRTLWSAEGSRMRVYCAEINGNNAFGGKSGFQPIEVTLGVKPSPGRNADNLPKVHDVQFLERVTTTFFDRCVRADVQRRDEDMFMSYIDLGQLDVNADYKAFPVVSLNNAPELTN